MIEILIKHYVEAKNDIENICSYVEELGRHYTIALVEQAQIDALRKVRGIIKIDEVKELTLFEYERVFGCISCDYDNFVEAEDLYGAGVIVAIIDSGIDYTHKEFIDENGNTRIKYIWDLSVEGKPPEGYDKGTVYTEEEINNALQTNERLNHYDYKGHGTAVASIAAGNTGVAKKSDIVVVKMGRSADGGVRASDIMRGLKFVYDIAITLDKPLVCNVSYGTNDGGHDGKSVFEQYIDDIMGLQESNIVIAQGNEGNSLHHFYGVVGTSQTIDCEVSISSGVSRLFLTMWYDFADDIVIKFRPPNGVLSEEIFLNRKQTLSIMDFEINVVINEPTPNDVYAECNITFVSSKPIMYEQVWIVQIIGQNIVDGRIDVWLPILEAVGKKSFFVSPNFDTTLTIPASAEKVISVAGYNSNINSIAEFSGRGLTRIGMQKPDIAAPAVNVTGAKVNGGYDVYTGTSMAAPIVTGVAAKLMEWGIVRGNDKRLYGERLKAYIHKGAGRIEEIEYPNKELGYGVVNAKNSLYYLENSYNKTVDSLDFDIQLIEEENGDSEFSAEYLVEYNTNIVDIVEKNEYAIIDKVIIGKYAVVKVNESFVDNFEKEINGKVIYEEAVVLGQTSRESMQSAGILQVQQQQYLDLRGQGVLVAVIDSGIDYTQSVFINDDNTSRIRYLWDQTGVGNKPSGFNYGVEYTRADISNALQSTNPLEVVPEKDATGHGTYIASIVAGGEQSDGYVGAAPDSELIVVKLKRANEYVLANNFVHTYDDAYQSTDIMQAIQYVIEKAEALKKPVCICITQGTTQGGHNGNSGMEKIISDIAQESGRCVVVSSGNERLAKNHVVCNLMKDNTYKFILQVGANDNLFALELWNKPYDVISYEIVTPLGEVLERSKLEVGFKLVKKFNLDNTVLNIKYEKVDVTSNLSHLKIGFENATAGIWSINVYGETIIEGTVNGWLTMSNFLGDETYFLNPEQNNTITIPSTARNIISVVGYDDKTGSDYAQSGMGYDTTGRIRPTIQAPAVGVVGVYPYGRGVMTGNSVGAAHVAGAGALLLEYGIVNENVKFMNTNVIAVILAKGAVRNVNDEYPNNVSGFGRVNLINSIKTI